MKIQLLYLIICISLPLFGQVDCNVLLPNINQKYTGECKKGLAHGNGTSQGIDKYTGEFKKGLPYGEGIYEWSNGNSFNGVWQDGKQHGKGSYTILKLNQPDSIVEGYWFKGEYVGEYENPYKVGAFRNISRSRIVKKSDINNEVYFFLKQNGMDKQVSNLVALCSTGGNYFDQGTGRRGFSNFQTPTTINVTFIATDSNGNNSVNCEFNIEIFEKGVWEITLNL